jgi:predicted TIM-barrel fold metal-dependent hydrolase
MTDIIDAHHHIWRQRDLPWLAGPMQPRIFGPYEPIRRDYLISEYLSDLKGTGVRKSVYVQANWAKDRFEDEVAHVQQATNETGFPHGIVGYADFLADDVRPQLDRLTKYPGMRGLRMQLQWHQNPQFRFASGPDLARDPKLQRNVGYLADYGWTFDLQVFSAQMAGAAELADSAPKVTFILQHAGMLEDSSDESIARWRTGMRQLAARPNVVSKLSALGTFIHKNDPHHIAAVVSETIAMFGPDRCLFGSNFPVEKLWTGYADLIAAYRSAIEPLGEQVARAAFHDTAARVYRLN